MESIRRMRDGWSGRVANTYLEAGEMTVASDHSESLPSERWSPRSLMVDGEVLRYLFREATDRIESTGDKGEIDGWLAPRLHAALRFRRRIAADTGVWAWLTLAFGAQYVRARWRRDAKHANLEWRFSGDLLRNGLSRLWWGAELARNGSSYLDVPLVFARANVAQFALELRYSWYRPAVIAFARVCASGDRGGLTDSEVRELSVRTNAYLGTAVLETLALHENQVAQEDSGWYEHVPSQKELTRSDVTGPSDGPVEDREVESFAEWLNAIVAEIRTPSEA